MKEYFIDKQKSVFDYAFPIFQDLVDDRRVKVMVSPVKEAVSIFLDITSFVHFFYKDLAVNLHCEGGKYNGFQSFRKKNAYKFIEAYIDNSIKFKNYRPKNKYTIVKIHPPAGKHASMFSVASSTRIKCKSKIFKLDSFLKEKFRLGPENKITLTFCRHTDFGTRLYLKYQKENVASEKPTHNFISEKAMDLIAKTIFYNDRSIISSIALDIMAGKTTIENKVCQIYPITKIEKDKKEKLEEIIYRRRELFVRIKRAMLVVPYFIYGISEGKNSSKICKDYGLVPAKYARLFSSHSMNAIRNIVRNPRDFLNLISSYNKFVDGELEVLAFETQTFRRLLDIKRIKKLKKITKKEFLKGATKVFS